MPSSTTTATNSTTTTHLAKQHQFTAAEEEEEEEIIKLLSQECKELLIQSIVSFQKHLKTRECDVVLATIPKSGTTWLKALAFAIINRQRFPASSSNPHEKNHPLLTSNPHDLVPFIEYEIYANNKIPDLSNLPEPRIFATHIPYHALEESMKKSDTTTKIVYLCRNPFDTLISSWEFLKKLRPESLPQFSFEEALKMYCNGSIGYGPFWEHMLGYWNESLKRPQHVLFLKYEDMKEDIVSNLKELAGFLGFPFTVEEEREGVIEDIAKLCSFEKLKELEINKSGKAAMKFLNNFENNYLFRKAQVGDWVNYFNPSMVQQLSKLMEDKFQGSGLSFKLL
ncbi:hypothetical protein ACOSP7_032007 [Xanthoceras sorbifolium]